MLALIIVMHKKQNENDISQQFWTILRRWLARKAPSDQNCSMDSLLFELGHCINIDIEMAKNLHTRINNTILRESSLASNYADIIFSNDDKIVCTDK